MLLRASVRSVPLFQPLSMTGGFALVVALRAKFFHRNFSRKCEQSWSSARNKMQDSFLALAGCQLQRGVFVIMTAYAGSLGNDLYVVSLILKLLTWHILEVPADQPTKVCEKLSEFRKSLHVQVRVVVRWGLWEGVFGLRLPHDFLHRTLIVITMIYRWRYGWHKDVFILFKRFGNQRLRQWNSLLRDLNSSWRLLFRSHKRLFHWWRRRSSKRLKRTKNNKAVQEDHELLSIPYVPFIIRRLTTAFDLDLCTGWSGSAKPESRRASTWMGIRLTW